MNLANLIAPEWVQDGCPARNEPKRPANALAPMGVVTRDSDRMLVHRVITREPMKRDFSPAHLPRAPRRPTGSLRRRILEQLSGLADGNASSSTEICEALEDVGHGSVCAVLFSLNDDKLVGKTGEARAFRYRITVSGRAVVADAAPGS